MADEYLHSRRFDMARRLRLRDQLRRDAPVTRPSDAAQARRFYGKICRAYQRERWWRALAHIQRSLRRRELSRAQSRAVSKGSFLSRRDPGRWIRCALELRDVSEYLQACVALLSREVSSAPEAEAVLGAAT